MMKYFSVVSEDTGVADIANVPVCASYCEAWFNACKNDKTCIHNPTTGEVYKRAKQAVKHQI